MFLPSCGGRRTQEHEEERHPPRRQPLARPRARGRWQCGEQSETTGGVLVRVLWLCSGSAGEGGAGDLKSETEGSGQACGGGALACCVFVQKARAALTETAITAIGYSLITPEQIQKRSKRFRFMVSKRRHRCGWNWNLGAAAREGSDVKFVLTPAAFHIALDSLFYCGCVRWTAG